MQPRKIKEGNLPRELGDGLILRSATLADTDSLVAYNACILSDMEKEEPDERVGAWTRDLMEGSHPTFKVSDFTLVEDTKTGKIVSSLNLISQTWSYAGIRFGVGRPELVSTHPDYRNRGLVRAQFELIHEWSALRGEKMQVITGIPYYYRQFGYEMGLSLGGGRLGYQPQIPKLDQGAEEPYHVRPAIASDLAFIADLYQLASNRYLVNCQWDEALWRYELEGKSKNNINRSELRLIETLAGDTVGYFAHPIINWGPTFAVIAFELKNGISWADVTPTVIRYMAATGKVYADQAAAKEFGAFAFWLGSDHPVYHVIPDRLPRVRQTYAWYVRIPDLPGFLSHIAPALEERLAESPLVGYSGELKITFYRDGLHLVFEQGRLVKIKGWRPLPQGHSGQAAFPDRTFLQLLFGYRSLDELKYAFADCWTDTDEATALLNVLFPKQVSNVWPVA